jgi:hypothetical protein
LNWSNLTRCYNLNSRKSCKTKTRIVSFESNNIIVEFKEYTHFKEYFKIINLVINSLK